LVPSISPLSEGCQIGFFDAKFHKFVFLEVVGDKKIVWYFGFFFFNISFGCFWRQFARANRLVSCFFKDLSESVISLS